MAVDPAKAKQIFLSALELESSEARSAFLADTCGDDHGLRKEVEDLIRAHEHTTGLLDEPVGDVYGTTKILPVEKIGSTIGPYKLLQQIGEGGMGTVYMAEQNHPIKRRVAVKVVKPGMDTREVVARFEAERQALALMDHPSIAKVFDCGSTDRGRPYFVMELVKGRPITDYCDEHNLTPNQRLQLFVQVCQAIQHAHQKGIIHRDLKPSNILVAEYDDQAVPKVIDFGIAKALSQELTEKTLFTQYGQVLGTIEYMSPEQAKVNQLDVDTRSDIFSLGVVLYELLAGTTPFDKQRLRSAAWDEMLRIIREEDPPRPSLRLSTLESAPSVAAHRHTEPKKLSALLRNELDWIVMKSMAKDRAHRYETANGLGRDIERFLAGEAVEAHPPSWGYLVSRFAKKHRATISVASAFAGLLIVGIILTSWLLVRAMRAEKDALAERDAKDIALKSEEESKNEAIRRFKESRRNLYIAHMQQIQLAWEKNNVAQISKLLDKYRISEPGQDLRGWEWYYWDRMCHLDLRTLNGHDKAVNFVAFSPDGSQVASAGADGTVRLWEVATGKQMQVFKGHQGAVRCVEFSPDGSWLASGGYDDKTVILWDRTTGNQIKSLEHSGRITSLAFSPDGKLLGVAAIGREPERKVWDTTNWQLKHTLMTPLPKAVYGVAFTPDGSQFVCVGAPDIEFWDPQDGTLIRVLTGHGEMTDNNLANKRMTSIMFSSDGAFFATGSVDRQIKSWNSQTGEEIHTFTGHDGDVNYVSICPKGKLLASASSDNSINLWQPTFGAQGSNSGAATNSALRALKGHHAAVLCVAVSPDGSRIASASADGTIKIWDAGHRLDLMRLITMTGHYHDVDFSPDGKQIAASVFVELSTRKIDNVVDICDADTGTGIDQLVGHTGWIYSTAFDPYGKFAATASQDQTVRIWDLKTGKTLKILDDFDAKMRWVNMGGLEFSRDGTKLVTCSSSLIDQETKKLSSELRIWDVETGVEIGAYPGIGPTFSPIGTFLAYEYEEPDSPAIEVRIINTTNGEVLQSWSISQPVNNIAFSHDGQLLAASLGRNQQVVVWDVASGEEVLSLNDAGSHVAFVSDAKRLLTLSKREVLNVWSVETGNLLCSIDVRPGSAKMVVSPDGLQVAFMGFPFIQILDIRPNEPDVQVDREARSLVSSLLMLPLDAYYENNKTGYTFPHAPLRKAEALENIQQLKSVSDSVLENALSLVNDLYQPVEEAMVFADVANGLFENVDSSPEDRQQAMQWAKTAVQIAPEKFFVQAALADALFRIDKNYSEALEHFQKALDLVEFQTKREKPAVLASIAMVQWHLGEKNKARETLQQVEKMGRLLTPSSKRYFQEANDLINGEGD